MSGAPRDEPPATASEGPAGRPPGESSGESSGESLGGASGGSGGPALVVDLIVDMANVVGSRPDGWWRDRAGANQRLLTGLAGLVGSELPGPDGGRLAVRSIAAVVEGQAVAVTDLAVDGLSVVRAERDGDSTVVALVRDQSAWPEPEMTVPEMTVPDGTVPEVTMLVVTADRGLRQRLPANCRVAGPGWLRELISRS